MTPDIARRIIQHAVLTTEPRWSEYDQSWENIDRIFIHHGYEQGGFEMFKFLPLMSGRGICSIEALGEILEEAGKPVKYDRSYAGGLESPFYRDLRNRTYGKTGILLYECVDTFLSNRIGRPGAFFWRIIWQMLVCCSHLKRQYNSSFKEYLKQKYAHYAGKRAVSESEILNLSVEDWARFMAKSKPWKELYGIGQNTFDFIVGDIVEARFASYSYKFDSANQHFLRVTGISNLMKPFDREGVLQFLLSLELPYNLRQINKGIYTYCSVTEATNYGFCRNRQSCQRCGVSGLCLQRFGVNLV